MTARRTRLSHASTSVPAPFYPHILQRKCTCGQHTIAGGECADCSKKREVLQRYSLVPDDDKGMEGEGGVPPIVHDVLSSPGQPLDPATRAFMESRLGHDFSQVRIHTNARAAEAARTIDAIAYTVGRHVVLPGGVGNSQLLAHELAHVVQQGGGDASDRAESISSPEDGWEREAARAAESVAAGRSFRPSSLTGSMVYRQGPPGPPPTLAGLTATRDAFNNAGAPDGANCAAVTPASLGVNGPAVGQNGMEMIFRIGGAIPPSTEFDITRTKATGVWQLNGGVWSHLGGWPAGTSDDHHDQDECLTPVAGRIFVVDTPGLPGTLNPVRPYPGAGAVAATATAAVWKLSFAEWVIARNRPLGIGWTRISTPVFHRWHSIFSVALVGGVWTRVDTPSGQHNEIELGSIPTAGATP